MNMIQLHDFQMILLLLWVFQPNQFDTIPAFLSAKSSRIVGGPPCNFTVGHEWNHQQGTKHHRIIDYPYSNNSWEQNQCPWRSCNFRYVVHIRNDDRVGFPFLQWQGANYNRFWTLGLHLCKIFRNRSPNATSNPMIKIYTVPMAYLRNRPTGHSPCILDPPLKPVHVGSFQLLAVQASKEGNSFPTNQVV